MHIDHVTFLARGRTLRTLAISTALIAVPGIARAGSVAAGAAHSAVVKTTDSTAWTWGSGGNGRLGIGSTTQQTLPVQVTSLTGVTAVAAGGSHTLFLKSDATVWATGFNSSGQLGDNTTTQRTSPVQVKINATTYLTGVAAIAAGLNFSLALKTDGTCWAFGQNNNGQLGNNSTSQSNVAVQVLASGGSPLTGITAIAAGDYHALAVKTGGTAWAWGNGGSGRLGNGSTSQSTTAVAVSFAGGTVITAVAAGGSHSLARKSDGTLWAFGSNANSRLGDGTTATYQTTPVQVVGLTTVTTMSAGKSHSVAVLSDGTVYTWGANGFGQLGDGSTTEGPLPGLVVGITNAISIVAAADHTLAVTSDGIVWAFGQNGNGQLGDGTTDDRLTPVSISLASFNWKVATPSFSVASGTYNATQSVTITCATSLATIRYTLDGSDPTTGSQQYSSAVSITVSATLKARAWKTNVPDSNVGQRVYTLQVLAPTLTPGTATYNTPQNVTMSTGTSGAVVRYTSDGSDPTAVSTQYAAPVNVAATTTLKARGFKTGWSDSAVTTRTYTMKVGTPSLNPVGGSYTSSQQVTVSTVTPSATLHYTTDGLDPTEADPVVASGATVPVNQTLTLKVTGWKSGWTTSDTTTASYFLNLGTVATPTVTPAAGTYTSSQTVSLSTATAGAIIRYTLDGSAPLLQSPIFGAPITLSGTTTVKAQAFKADMTPSAVSTATYTINLGAVETPTLSVASGTYTTSRTVTISCATADASIYYTTNGFDPTQSDTPIASGGLLTVDRAMVVKVKAWKTGLPASAVARRDYVITGALAAGGYHSLALKADATVWSFGKNANGQLGDSTTTNRTSPVPVTGLSGVIAVAAGADHSLALKSDGTVVSWGLNSSGQLGDGSTTQKTSPVPVPGLTGVVAIAAGASHSLALKSDATVMSWGKNVSGQLGNGTYNQSSTPVAVSGLTGAVAVAAHSDHSLALKSDGTLRAFGNNWNGQLGDGTNTNRNTPVAVLGPAGVTRIAAGDSYSLALKTSSLGSGTLWAWGYNGYSQLGDGTTDSRNKPLSGLSDIVALEGGERHTLAITSDGMAWAWGDNSSAQIGNGATSPPRAVPTRVVSPPELLSLDGGQTHSLALAVDGRIWGWGGNALGQLGDGTTTQRTSPVPAGTFEVAGNSWLASDSDQDGLSNASEYRIGTDPLNPDTNADGIPDGIEFQINKRPFDPDADGDGLTNAREIAIGTDPFVADSDGDGVLDGADAFPMDPTQSQAISNPNDQTPPTITLQEPTNATLLP